MPAETLHLHNTLSKRVEPFLPGNPGHITFYTCGPTVYDDAHIGNFRSFLAADLLRRFIESPLCTLASEGDGPRHRGPRSVTHVMNITDVGHMTDDAEGGEHGEDRMAVAGKRLEEAKKAGKLPAGVSVDLRDPYAIARFYEERFKEDARNLGLKIAILAQADATLMPRATESIAGMIQVISRLEKMGAAYCIGAPGSRVVYFNIQSFPSYGKLSGNTLDNLKAGEGGRITEANQATKRHPADFLLWKEDATHIMKWDSPWGKGYPGWHIECTVMAASRLAGAAGHGHHAAGGGGGHAHGPHTPADLANLALRHGEAMIDLHSGGEDNIFPHHECEIAQSCCAFNGADAGRASFARMWFHPRFLFVEGAKMSKSKGNFYTPRQLMDKGIQPAAIRLELIRTHYRSNANFTMQGLEDAGRLVDRWRRTLAAEQAGSGGGSSTVDLNHPSLKAFAEALHDDLNIAEAIAAVNQWVASIKTPTAEDAKIMRTFDAVLGVLDLPQLQGQASAIGVYLPGVEASEQVEALLVKRLEARKQKDFAASDRIRDELLGMGYTIKDVAGGKVEIGRAK